MGEARRRQSGRDKAGALQAEAVRPGLASFGGIKSIN
jgi:hypothetical protein